MPNDPLIVAMGEAMVRFTALNREPLASAHDYRASVAGSELNFLTTVCGLGGRGRWLTRLPVNDLATLVRRHAQSYGIEVRAVDEIDGRLGLFFLEFGAPPRPSRVLYDRADSAVSHLSADDFDWGEVLEGASVAHTTGITCALGAALGAADAFLRAARVRGAMTSFDVNYRSRLWTADEAAAALRGLLDTLDVVFVSPGDLVMLTGSTEPFAVASELLRERYGIATVVVREREEIGPDELAARVYVFADEPAFAEARGRVIDELGAGDAAAGAFVTALARGDTTAVAAEQAARAYARMLTLPGDAWSGSLADLGNGFHTSRTLVR